jgi:EmrB/QacA subfamily drug resistance transporter
MTSNEPNRDGGASVGGSPGPDIFNQRRYEWGILPKTAVAIAYVASMFMSAMDTHIVNVMIPTLSRKFHEPLSSVQWVSIGYILSLAIVIPASGWIGDRFGTKRTFLVALGIFTLASAACGQAASFQELVIFRILQGVGGGMLTPVGTAMLYRAYPPSERARMTRLLLVPILLGPVLAQPVGGYFVEYLSWRWAFYLNVPIGVVAFIISVLFLVEHRQPGMGRFDVPGFILSGAGLSLFLVGFSEGSISGWSSLIVVVGIPVSLVMLAVFIRHEIRQKTPLLRVGLVKDRIFRATNVVNGLNTFAFAGLLFLAPIFLQEGKGETPLAAGLTTFATAVGVIVGTQTLGRLYHVTGPRRMATLGSVGLAIMLSTFFAVGSGTNLWFVRLLLFSAGLCNSATAMAVQTSMFSTISVKDTGSGASLFSAARQSATAIGVATLTTVITLGSHPFNVITSFHLAFLAAATFSLLAGLASVLLIHDSDAANTMKSKNTRAEMTAAAVEAVE